MRPSNLVPVTALLSATAALGSWYVWIATEAPAGPEAVSQQGQGGTLTLRETTLTVPQVDYEPAIYYRQGDPYPHLDFARVNNDRVVRKQHVAVILENDYVRLTLLPQMGRVYALYYKPTGHDELWRNDIVTVGGGLNDTGWWIWIGGVEYTLPGDEHGTTWSTPWTWAVLENSQRRKTVRMQVEELGTGLRETIDVSLYPARAYYEARIRIANPTDMTVHYAHWVNPQWTPGGHNELTDNTEFIIPTEKILIAGKWQENMGPSPQPWAGNRYRFIKGWAKMGDLMADDLTEGFYSAYSHDEEEGIVRVFDKEKTPGVDVWSYGYRTTRIPMGSGAPNKGYVEMWGGTSKLYPDETRPLHPGASVEWTEWMYPYHGTKGLTFADRELAVNFRLDPSVRRLVLGVCPSGEWRGVIELWDSAALEQPAGSARPLRSWPARLRPGAPFLRTIDLSQPAYDHVSGIRLRLGSDQAGWRILGPELRSGPRDP